MGDTHTIMDAQKSGGIIINDFIPPLWSAACTFPFNDSVLLYMLDTVFTLDSLVVYLPWALPSVNTVLHSSYVIVNTPLQGL